jgi:hypothetical protein
VSSASPPSSFSVDTLSVVAALSDAVLAKTVVVETESPVEIESETVRSYVEPAAEAVNAATPQPHFALVAVYDPVRVPLAAECTS